MSSCLRSKCGIFHDTHKNMVLCCVVEAHLGLITLLPRLRITSLCHHFKTFFHFLPVFALFCFGWLGFVVVVV